MLAFLRRSRIMALAMVLLAPGITGTAVQWLHACPAQARQVSDHQHHDPSPSQSQHPQDCRCIGSCNAAATASPARSLTVAAAVIEPDQHITPLSGVNFVPSSVPSDLLPPATAPPLS